MVNTISGSWVADLPTMTCRHLVNKMILQFVKDGTSLKPEIKDMPKELLAIIAQKPTNLSSLQKLVEEGEEVFLRTYFEIKIDNDETP